MQASPPTALCLHTADELHFLCKLCALSLTFITLTIITDTGTVHCCHISHSYTQNATYFVTCMFIFHDWNKKFKSIAVEHLIQYNKLYL